MSADYPAGGELPPLVDNPLSGGGWGGPTPFDDVQVATVEPVHLDGEIIDAEVVEVVEGPRIPIGGEAELLPVVFAQNGERAVQLFRDPEAVAKLTHEARLSLLQRIEDMAARARAQRPDGRPSSSQLAPELTLMADAHDTLNALSTVFAAGAERTRAISGEIAVELADDPRKQSSVRVGDAHGRDVKVTRSQPTEMRVDDKEIVDVIVAACIGAHVAAVQADPELPQRKGYAPYAQGARDAIALYQRLAAAHTFKSSELDVFVRELEGAAEDALAIRLGHAYGRVSKGDAKVKIERVDRKAST